MKKSSITFLLLVSIFILSPGIIIFEGRAQNTSPQTHEVLVQNFRFFPKVLEINIGDEVVFRWTAGSTGHNVAQVFGKNDNSFNGTGFWTIIQDGPVEWTLPIDYVLDNVTLYYICEPHVLSHNMRGKIIVGEGSPGLDDEINFALFWGIVIGVTVLVAAGFVLLVKKSQKSKL